jgi:hypothetical protein
VILTTFSIVAALTVTVTAILALDDRILNGQWLLLVIICPVLLYLVGSFTTRRT